MYTIGYDIGSSSVKAALVEAATGKVLARVQAPQEEMSMQSPQSGWAEQDPELWYQYVVETTEQLLARTQVPSSEVKAVGIGYQMHGLVLVDADHKVIRPSIIWCDGRAVSTGEQAFVGIGQERCLSHCLNSPGNFTAAKLKWVADHEPDNYARTAHAMLPGDYIALRLTGQATTTVTGLSEGVLWDFKQNQPAELVLEEMGLDADKLCPRVPAVGQQGTVSETAARETGLAPGTIVGYRAGDQPNNAMSLNVIRPGEVAATAGTSGVVYGVTDRRSFDPGQRVNSFAHVNHGPDQDRIGILLCINGTGIAHRWIRQQVCSPATTYENMERIAAGVPIGSEGLHFLPFGNGPERMLQNREVGARLLGLDFNRHTRDHLVRAGIEGVAFSFVYGMRVMQELGVSLSTIRVGNDNMFQSQVFASTISTLTGATIEVHNTNGAVGAALAAGVSAGLSADLPEAVGRQEVLSRITPQPEHREALEKAYGIWAAALKAALG
ncbi:xylulokinase [Lewinella marina]|uniref:Carbohydrate kinase n=1 Tax=Neolewinella marina TaxID=438751 RepID=A0A2G0CFA1_9BACT|nr:FGGY family carbohydrate kinase [Neolewinella marina]NJB85662.1 xylulokinase [Neolewinella marina]PHK98656.1 carbohydrate kinase [Neolewinella marina]